MWDMRQIIGENSMSQNPGTGLFLMGKWEIEMTIAHISKDWSVIRVETISSQW